MIEIEDGYSADWAELTEGYYNENETDFAPSAPKQEQPRKPNTARCQESLLGLSELENEYPSLTGNSSIRQRERDFDARSKLTRNRGSYRGGNDHWRRHVRGGYRDSAARRRDSYEDNCYLGSSPHSDQPWDPHRSSDTSPFRSPLNRAKRSSFQYMDNSNNFRFTNQRRGGGSRSRPESGGNRFNNNRHSPVRDEKNRSCRRLYMPSENGDYKEPKKRFQVVTEEDKVKLARREKDIAYGKNTDDYKTYVQVVPKHKRRKNSKLHPRTPDKFVHCSRRSWDAQVKRWKLDLHAWAAQQDTNSRGECSQKSSYSEGTTETSECTSDKDQEFSLEVNDSYDFSEEEEDTNEKVLEESFEVNDEEDTNEKVLEESFEVNDEEDTNEKVLEESFEVNDEEDTNDKVEEESFEANDDIANKETDEVQEESPEATDDIVEQQGEEENDDDDAFLESLDYSLLVGAEKDQ